MKTCLLAEDRPIDMGLIDYFRTAKPGRCSRCGGPGKGRCRSEAAGEGKWEKVVKASDPFLLNRLRVRYPSLLPGLVGKTLAVWLVHRKAPLLLGTSPVRTFHIMLPCGGVADAPVYTAGDMTSSRDKTLVLPTSDVRGSSQPKTSEESADSFYETAVLNSEDAKRWSRTEHELELKEKLRAKYDARGVLLGEKDAEIARLKSLVKEKETESAEVSALKSAILHKDTDISLLDSRASYLKYALDDSQAACDEARNLISSLSSERDGLASEVSTLHSTFSDFKEKMEAQQEAQAQELYNRVAELESHVMDVSGRLEEEFYPAYLTTLAGRRWLLTHGMELAMIKCLKSPDEDSTRNFGGML
ncbi:hypothetical protein Tco_0566390 [Tanacetum coccineum]